MPVYMCMPLPLCLFVHASVVCTLIYVCMHTYDYTYKYLCKCRSVKVCWALLVWVHVNMHR